MEGGVGGGSSEKMRGGVGDDKWVRRPAPHGIVPSVDFHVSR